MPRICLAGVFAAIAVLAVVVPAAACPNCPTARVVTQTVCGGDWWQNVAITGVPFAVFSLVGLGLHRMGRTNRSAEPSRQGG